MAGQFLQDKKGWGCKKPDDGQTFMSASLRTGEKEQKEGTSLVLL